MNFFLILDMCFLYQLIGGTDHVFMYFEHYRGDVDVVIQVGVVFLLNLF